MGNHLSIISPEKFRDQIFSIVMYYVAPKANGDLKFTIREKCTSDNLVMPEDPDYRKMLDFYNLTDKQVLEYVNKNILNSEENLARFYQTLITQLRGSEDPKLKKLTGLGFQNQKSDYLTRSRLDRIDSRQPSLASVGWKAKKPASIYSNKNKSAKNQSNKSNKLKSHFTQSEIVRNQSVNEDVFPDTQKAKQNLIGRLLGEEDYYPGGIMSEDFSDVPEDFCLELEGSDDGFSEKSQMRSRSRGASQTGGSLKARSLSRQSEKSRPRDKSRQSEKIDIRDNDMYHSGMDEVEYQSKSNQVISEGNLTQKHKRFGKEAVIKEDF